MLPRTFRLPSKDIPEVLRRGIQLRGEGVDFVYKKNRDPGFSRFAFIVSVKVDKRATVRNRMKRLLREAVQRIVSGFPKGIDGVLVVRGKLPDSKAEVEVIVRAVFRKLGILSRE